VKDQNILVVDDITDTGQSLELATAHVRTAGARRVESATCLHITHSTFLPTYFAEEIPREAWVWVVFPWNFWEDLATLGRRALEETGTSEKAVALLRERCGLEVTESDLKFALEGTARSP
jgi:hypoxanthine phosphoribosyltransferase